jgi:hypothetical protein
MIKVRSNSGTLTLTEQMAGEMDRGMTKRLNAAAMTGVRCAGRYDKGLGVPLTQMRLGSGYPQ